MKYLFFSYCLVAFISCESVYEFDDLPQEKFLVVDGRISTDISRCRVVLSGSTNFNSQTQFPERYSDAEVIVVKNQLTNYSFTNRNGSNIYYPPDNFVPEVNDEFELKITWQGKNYFAKTQRILPRINFSIDTLRSSRQVLNSTNNLSLAISYKVLANISNNSSSDSLFTRWSWSEELEHPYTYRDSLISAKGKFNISAQVPYQDSGSRSLTIAEFPTVNFIWNEPAGFSISPNQLEDDDYFGEFNEFTSNQILDSLNTINRNSPSKSYLYTINLRASNIDSESYRYWQKILNQQNNTGSIFDSQPTSIVSNITIENNSEDDVVLGFFYVENVTSKSISLPFRVRKL